MSTSFKKISNGFYLINTRRIIMRRKILIIILILVLLPIAYLLLWPVPIDPVSWTPPKAPELEGLLAPNHALVGADLILKDIGKGPEDIAFDEQGNLYSGFEGGMIVKLSADGNKAETYANTGGRPLGMVFDRNGNLIVADALKGLLSVDKKGDVTVFATEAGGIPINFADDLDIGPDGSVYFSDASVKFGYGKDMIDLLEHGGNGRLLRYNPLSNKTEVLLDGLQFANGVTVAKDGSFVLVSDMGAYRIHRLWLNGPRKGKVEIFIDNLPGFPDNINLTERGTVLVALPALRSKQMDDLASKPFLRKVIYRVLMAFALFSAPETPSDGYGLVVELDNNGSVLRSFHDPTGRVAFITSAMEREGFLYLGSPYKTYAAVASLKK
jgi:sugar lactone lactonase YvrE